MKTDDRVSGCVLLILSILICIGASRLHVGSLSNPGAGFFPFVLGGVSGVLSLWVAGKAFLEKPSLLESRPPKTETGGKIKAFVILLSLVVYGLLLDQLGFILTTFFLFVCLLKGISSHNWKVVIGGALFASLGSYIIFQVLLDVQLPKGFLGM